MTNLKNQAENTKRRPSLLRPVGLLLALASAGCLAAPGEAADPGDAVCQDAIAIIEDCTGEAPRFPSEGCLAEYAEAAERVTAEGCAALDTSDGKADAGGFFCWPVNRWMGVCDELTLAEASAIASVDDVCGRRDDALCAALRDGDYLSAGAEARRLVAETDREAVLMDPAFRLYVRERIVSLLVYNVVTSLGRDAASVTTYRDSADEVLREHYPAYEPESFPMARELAPPAPPEACSAPRAALLIYPGVVRLGDRDEFDQQRSALARALPCLATERIDTGSFVDPEINAGQSMGPVEALRATNGDLPLHLLGYSQGGRNALQTLVDQPTIAASVRTVVTLNSAAHGTEVADTFHAALSLLEGSSERCDWVDDVARPMCLWAAEQSVTPSEGVITLIAASMGVPVENLGAFIAAEDGVAAAPDLSAFLRAHLPGLLSLTTTAADEFWRDQAPALPRDTLYLSFRSVVSDRDENLPISNALGFDLLRNAGGTNPWNDMQVRLVNQHMGGAVRDLEVVEPVAEGNHWQWELATGAVPEAVMPADMTERIPHEALLVSHYQALAEVGLLFDEAGAPEGP